MRLNMHYQALQDNYLFADIARRVEAYCRENPEADVIRLGIGDVTRPLPPTVVEALQTAAAEMGDASTFRGYGPEQGYDFLRKAIAADYSRRGVELAEHEIFVSDGAKSDLGNILDLFEDENTVLVPDPVYPVYVDTNVMAGRHIRYVSADEENGFLPLPDPSVHADLIYICSPNNPTGAAYDRRGLEAWVEYADGIGAVILFDAAYACFVKDEGIPRSIYEIEGAKSCAIEFCSFSKMAGFTGLRCGWTVVPENLRIGGMSLRQMWLRRQTTKFNGVPYVVQRAAEAVFTPEGQKGIQENLRYYKRNAGLLAGAMEELGVFYTGGKNSPYIWLKCPDGMESWDFFQKLLEQAQVVGTPGAGFGPCGRNFFRLTAFGNYERTAEAIERIKKIWERA